MATVTLRPDANISVQCSQYPTSGYNYDKVNEVTSDGDSTYVYAPGGTNAYYYDLYDIPSSGIPVGSTINSVAITIVVRSAGYGTKSTNVATRLNTHATIYETSYIIANSSTYSAKTTTYTTNPYTGAAWTLDEVNSMDIGVMCRDIYLEPYDSGARCTQVYVVIDYTPPTAVAKKTMGDGLTWIMS